MRQGQWSPHVKPQFAAYCSDIAVDVIVWVYGWILHNHVGLFMLGQRRATHLQVNCI